MIGGQFLVCANDDQLAQQDDSEGSFGCRIELADGTKLNNLSPTNEDIIAEGESILIQGQANNNPDGFWHWTFSYYPDQRDLIIVKLVNPAISVVNGMTEVLDAHPQRSRQDLEDDAENEEVEDDEEEGAEDEEDEEVEDDDDD